MTSKDQVSISGIWLRNYGNYGNDVYEVLVEIDGKWRLVIKEQHIDGGVTSHIVEALGIIGSPEDK